MRVESVGPVVLDTNVWISAFLTKTGTSAALVRHLLVHARPVFSPATFDELKMRLWRPKFDRYLSMDDRKLLLHDLNAVAHWVDPPQEIVVQASCRDADDDKFIHAALASGAGLLVSGDDDLLCLHPLGNLRILTPRAALTALTGPTG